MSNIPEITRRAVIERAKGRCEDCDVLLGSHLEMHHLRYHIDTQWGPEPIEGREESNDLDGLCRGCHLNRHLDMNRDFWADPVEKEVYWTTYWSEMEKP